MLVVRRNTARWPGRGGLTGFRSRLWRFPGFWRLWPNVPPSRQLHLGRPFRLFALAVVKDDAIRISSGLAVIAPDDAALILLTVGVVITPLIVGLIFPGRLIHIATIAFMAMDVRFHFGGVILRRPVKSFLDGSGVIFRPIGVVITDHDDVVGALGNIVLMTNALMTNVLAFDRRIALVEQHVVRPSMLDFVALDGRARLRHGTSGAWKTAFSATAHERWSLFIRLGVTSFIRAALAALPVS